MKTVRIRKGQVRKLKDGSEVFDVSMQIPIEHFKLLGWQCGEELKVTSDKRTGKLTAERA